MNVWVCACDCIQCVCVCDCICNGCMFMWVFKCGCVCVCVWVCECVSEVCYVKDVWEWVWWRREGCGVCERRKSRGTRYIGNSSGGEETVWRRLKCLISHLIGHHENPSQSNRETQRAEVKSRESWSREALQSAHTAACWQVSIGSTTGFIREPSPLTMLARCRVQKESLVTAENAGWSKQIGITMKVRTECRGRESPWLRVQLEMSNRDWYNYTGRKHWGRVLVHFTMATLNNKQNTHTRAVNLTVQHFIFVSIFFVQLFICCTIKQMKSNQIK